MDKLLYKNNRKKQQLENWKNQFHKLLTNPITSNYFYSPMYMHSKKALFIINNKIIYYYYYYIYIYISATMPLSIGNKPVSLQEHAISNVKTRTI